MVRQPEMNLFDCHGNDGNMYNTWDVYSNVPQKETPTFASFQCQGRRVFLVGTPGTRIL